MSLTTIALAELVEDLDVYPRSQVSSVHVGNIVAALQAGQSLPPPIVDRKSKRIVDGFHRCRGYRKFLGVDGTIEVQMRTFKSDAELFAAAVELNVDHGLPLQEFEKRRITLRLRDMGADDDAIGKVLHIPPDRVEKLTLRTATTTIGGGQLKLEPLKRPIFHMQGKELSSAQVTAIKTAPGTSYGLLVRQLREAVKYGFLDLTDSKLLADVVALHSEIGELLSGQEATGT